MSPLARYIVDAIVLEGQSPTDLAPQEQKSPTLGRRPRRTHRHRRWSNRTYDLALTSADLGDQAAVRRRETSLAKQRVERRVHDGHAVDSLQFHPPCQQGHPDQRAQVVERNFAVGQERTATPLEV